MSSTNIIFTMYLMVFVLAAVINAVYCSIMMKRTGLFFSPAVIGGLINGLLVLGALWGWFYFAWPLNEFLFFGGMVLGVCMFVAGEFIIVVSLVIKKKKSSL
ncbi:hypothetical protein [Bacillus sp. KH172YL63]|uniref:hypothetical protein n=1 Tax=Bacillus sp. KH172YL63 TaxID=2709784 RepID=UPI0013E43417|nr:hypothetical protein [Bacillus sp. KH172YL63]BCB02702.1 hypothetical protein KH172YL63_08350 [Bacillus sp. KH172YL63]